MDQDELSWDSLLYVYLFEAQPHLVLPFCMGIEIWLHHFGCISTRICGSP